MHTFFRCRLSVVLEPTFFFSFVVFIFLFISYDTPIGSWRIGIEYHPNSAMLAMLLFSFSVPIFFAIFPNSWCSPLSHHK